MYPDLPYNPCMQWGNHSLIRHQGQSFLLEDDSLDVAEHGHATNSIKTKLKIREVEWCTQSSQ